MRIAYILTPFVLLALAACGPQTPQEKAETACLGQETDAWEARDEGDDNRERFRQDYMAKCMAEAGH